MKEIEHHDVKIFTDNIEKKAIEQINNLLSIGAFGGCKIRIMPDVHAGSGCVIGFTGDLGDKVIPNIVGVDIGCGISVQPVTRIRVIDFRVLNKYIVLTIPVGRKVRDEKQFLLPQKYMKEYREAKKIIRELRCYRELKDVKRLDQSIGTLGGGNHFIELDEDDNGLLYLLIHTGSRNLGKQVALIYQKLAVKCQSGWAEMMEQQGRIIEEYKQAGKKDELQVVIRNLHNSFKMHKSDIPSELAYLENQYREDYLHDMRLCQRWAQINREVISNLIMDHLMSYDCVVPADMEKFESVHNYIGNDNIIRKGAISARAGERCIIPLNMRDGALVCVGKGNEDWNFSAPHGAGRVMSRRQAFKEISMDEFRQSMADIYSETVTEETKDESPMAYKPKDEIIQNIQETVTIENIIKPIFNFKAAE